MNATRISSNNVIESLSPCVIPRDAKKPRELMNNKNEILRHTHQNHMGYIVVKPGRTTNFGSFVNQLTM